MSEQPGNTTLIQGLLDRLSAGDESAKDELIKHSMERLQRLARKMLRENPAVRRWNETDDVLQNALIRLNRALHTERPESTRRFIGLAAMQIRRELIDLWRHYYGPQGDGAHHASDPRQANSQDRGNPIYDQGAVDTTPSEIVSEDMERFHTLVGELPEKLGEVFEKSFYLDMTQDEIAKDIGVSTKTIKRRWRDAKLQLEETLHQGSE
jgi:RNA polymerase sigma-70 factor (ECF subfamily)